MTGARRDGVALASRRGFTVLELTVVLVLAGLGLGFAGLTFSGYFQRSSARHAAQAFAQDLTLARSAAVRAREPVVIRFFEANRWYQVVYQSSGTEVVTRRFGVNAELPLSALDSRLQGDTMVFNSRGVASYTPASGATLGEVRFRAGAAEYGVAFNTMGASKVEETVESAAARRGKGG